MKKKKTETDTEKRIQETSKKMANEQNGITLVALVITIIRKMTIQLIKRAEKIKKLGIQIRYVFYRTMGTKRKV